jgi:hypothetical protein
MYEAILKKANRNRDFRFKTRITPYPQSELDNAFGVTLVTTLVFAYLLTIMAGNITEERTTGMKQLQILSGLPLSSYWISNFTIDLIKLQIPTIILSLSLNHHPTFLLFPLTAIPATYVLTFAF